MTYDHVTFDRRKSTIFRMDGTALATGIWAGHGTHANVVTDEGLHGLGPLPGGLYQVDHLRDGGHLGRDVMNLVQVQGNTFGRSLFRVHGAAYGDVNHSSSDGCIIAGDPIRLALDKLLGGTAVPMASRLLRVV